jgi:hypothetical protein
MGDSVSATGMNECLAELSDTQTVERLNWRAGEAPTTAVSAVPTSPDRSAEAGIPGRDFEHGR